ncbi:cytochrome P450 [Limtongia smithiae]|uniref:cytochrome P450 n=1 Tax=Limtongia smithiae TaxID=1125753 RepID=UPI0034CDB830
MLVASCMPLARRHRPSILLNNIVTISDRGLVQRAPLMYPSVVYPRPSALPPLLPELTRRSSTSSARCHGVPTLFSFSAVVPNAVPAAVQARPVAPPSPASILLPNLPLLCISAASPPSSQDKTTLASGDLLNEVRRRDDTPFFEYAEDNRGQDILVLKSVLNYDAIFPLRLHPSAVRLRSFQTNLRQWRALCEGGMHKQQSKLLLKAFSFVHMNSLMLVFLDESRRFVAHDRNLITDAATGSDANQAEIDVHETLTALTLDIIYQAGLYLPFKANRALWHAREVIRRFAVEAVEKKLEAHAQRQREGQVLHSKEADLISVMIEETGGEWTVFDMAGQLTTFLVAGHETAASACSIDLNQIAKCPAIQDRLRAKIRSHFPGGLVSITSLENVDSRKYLNNVAREVLRLTPPVIGTIRMARKDTTIAEKFIPKGTFIIFSFAALNKSPELWGDDALVFHPDRWNCRQATSNIVFLSFSQGRRGCIGRRFAELSFKTILLALVSSFEFKIKEAHTTKWEAPVTYRPVNRLPMIVGSLPDW